MKKLLFTFSTPTFIFTLFLFAFLFVNLKQIKPAYADLTLSASVSGSTVTFTMNPAANSSLALIVYDSSNLVMHDSGVLGNISTYPWNAGPAPNGDYHAQVFAFGTTPFSKVATFTLGGGGGGGGVSNIGKINPGTLPSVPTGGESSFIAGIIRASISLLILVAFIVDFLWTIFAGLRFITAGGDPKTVGQAWTQIYWGLIGMVVVLGSFAIIKLVETFFGVTIISGGFQLPTI